MTLEQKAGQLFAVGFPQEYPSDEFMNLVREYRVGNVILFTHNISSRQQVSELTKTLFREIGKATGVIPLISIDEEGGVVSRLPEDTAIMPSARAQAGTGEEQTVRRAARIVGEELKAMGINFNLAPVLDINSNKDNPLIGVRSFGKTAEQVRRFGGMAVKGYLDAGILCSGKHFPGHGDTKEDSHLALPVVEADRELLMSRELEPFAHLIRQGLPAVTVGHMVVPALEPERLPCTMSGKVVTGLLREQMRFDGLIISDCLEMAAIKDFYGISRGTVEALKAGIDLIFISHTASAAEEAVLAVRKAIAEGELSMERIDDAVAHILAAKKRFGTCVWEEGNAGTKEQMEFAAAFLTRTIRPEQDTGQRFNPGRNPLFIGAAPGRVALVCDGRQQKDFAHFMQEHFGGEAIVCSEEPTEEEIREYMARAADKSSLITGTLNAHLKPGQRRMLEMLGSLDIPKAHVALRDPADLDLLSGCLFRLSLYEYTVRAMEAAKEYFVPDN
jgi:beta-N-acetylhexosaminidase